MMKSMTAYGRAAGQTPLGKVVIELHSVNRKLLDISMMLPKDWLCYDIDLRKVISSAVERGQVTLRIALDSGDRKKISKNLTEELTGLKKEWDQIAKALGFNPKEAVSLPFLLQQVSASGDKAEKTEDKKTLVALIKILKEALEKLDDSKRVEGIALETDLSKHLKEIEEGVESIDAHSKDASIHYREKLLLRIADVCGNQAAADERILKEVALFADRVDITEEIVRLRSHFSQFRATMKSKEKSIGRKLDFFVQEMLREVGTISAKTAETAVSTLTVNLRSILEKMKEQIQNIE